MNEECEHCPYRNWYHPVCEYPVCVYYTDEEEYDDIYDDLNGLGIDDIM